MAQTEQVLARGGGFFDKPAVSLGGFLRRDYKSHYWVSGNVTPDQIEGVVYGMYTDFELGYEENQAGRIDFYSAYAPEDLPSDHIGFWAYVNNKDWNDVPGILASLGEVTPWQGGSLLFDTIITNQALNQMSIAILCFPRNQEFMPMAPETTDHGGGVQETRWKNKPWPKWLEITPIPSGPDTWKRFNWY